MSELINIILAKPEWQTKMENEEIVSTWREETIAQGISPKVFDCILELLQSYKDTSENDHEGDDEFEWDVRLGVDVETDLDYRCDCKCACCYYGYNKGNSEDEDEEEDTSEHSRQVKKARAMVCECTDEKRIARHQKFVNKFALTKNLDDADLKAALVTQIAALEKSFTEIDYHPGSNNQVIDLVHPSLFCYVKGVSEIQNVGSEEDETAPTTDAVFQWLPSEFTVNRDEDNAVESVSIDSYINNLPRENNEDLYDSIGHVFGKLVPQFDELLETLHKEKRLPASEEDERELITLSKCQVIVKLANIVIAPGENASFPGGHWHLEGMATERIVATGIYYYDMTNVAPNKLLFRSTLSDTEVGPPYHQCGYDGVLRHHGIGSKSDNDDLYESIIELGSVDTVEDLLLVFPNFLQHKVSDFTLLDPKQQGTRKILCFFLINPYEQVVSTAHVAPQQNSGMTLEEAQMYRELLMFQRKYEIDDQTHFFERGWSLCEH